jgi:acetyl-CoA decarbonylase/synthase complex subunit delta
MLVNPGEETWKVKESKVGEGVPTPWGDWERRALAWEAITATTLLLSGADILVLRHPETMKRIRGVIEQLGTSA